MELTTKLELGRALAALGITEGDLAQLTDLIRAKAETCAEAAQAFADLGTAEPHPLVRAMKESEEAWALLAEKVDALGRLLR